MPITIRLATPADAARCGQICFDAFSHINRTHNFPSDFPDAEHAIGLVTMLFSAPGFYCVVAEDNGTLLGSNCLDERSLIYGIGPITVDPATQNRGVGRLLMQAVLDRASSQCAAGVRLVQAGFHNRSLSLYTTLGFDVREPLACMQGRAAARSIAGIAVRAASQSDIAACDSLSHAVHGFARSTELSQAIARGGAQVAERDGRITAYTTALGFFGHTTAETNSDLFALIAAADILNGPGVLVPTRNAVLFRWCLANGLRVVQPLNLMSLGLYNQPAGVFLPSILY